MNRPARQHAHLLEKIARKESRGTRKPGARTKAWRKWAEKYKPVAEGAVAETSGGVGNG